MAAAPSAAAAPTKLVIVDYVDLEKDSVDSNFLALIEQAFGSEGPGLIAVRNVPGFVEAKRRLLPMAHELVHLPEKYLEEHLTDPESLYNVGWSHGKEKLGGVPDFHKASFYFNPCTDKPGTEEDRKTYPLSYPCNVWPDDKLPGLEPAAKDLGLLLQNVTVKVAKHLDTLIACKVSSYQSGTLFQALEKTEKVKCRLLYYYPKEQSAGSDGSNDDNSSWIGWHNDSGFLTALAGDIYIDHTTGSALESCPDDQAGLYVADRQDNPLHVVIPPDCMAIQLGECTQVLSGGTVIATPHWVRAAEGAPYCARISLAAFVDTPPGFPLVTPEGYSRDKVCRPEIQSQRVPPLEKRWTQDGMTFGDFLTQTFQMYYEWTSPKETTS